MDKPIPANLKPLERWRFILLGVEEIAANRVGGQIQGLTGLPAGEIFTGFNLCHGHTPHNNIAVRDNQGL